MVKKILKLSSTVLATVVTSVTVNAGYIEYTPLGVPDIDTSFKTYMDYKMIKNTSSPQYKFIDHWGWSDWDGFMRCNGEPDWGVDQDYYLVALGSYYGTTVGTKYRFTTSDGNVFYGVLADLKGNSSTNSTHQYSHNQDVIEFLVDTDRLIRDVKVWGNANVYPGLSGSVTNVERMDFVY